MAAPDHGGISAEDFRATLGRFASGVTIITAREPDGTVHGMTASAFVSVSLNPPLILVSVDHRAHMNGVLHQDATTHFGVSILAEDQQELSNHFAGRPGPEERVPWRQQGHVDHPVIGETVARMVCHKREVIEAGDHTLYIGFIESAEYSDKAPLLYYKGRYGQLASEE